MLKRSQIKLPTPAEDAAITAAALQDPDAQPLTDAELAQFKRAPHPAIPAGMAPKTRATPTKPKSPSAPPRFS